MFYMKTEKMSINSILSPNIKKIKVIFTVWTYFPYKLHGCVIMVVLLSEYSTYIRTHKRAVLYMYLKCQMLLMLNSVITLLFEYCVKATE